MVKYIKNQQSTLLSDKREAIILKHNHKLSTDIRGSCCNNKFFEVTKKHNIEVSCKRCKSLNVYKINTSISKNQS